MPEPISLTFRNVMMISWTGCKKFKSIASVDLTPFGPHEIVNCFCWWFVSSISFIRRTCSRFISAVASGPVTWM